MCSSRKYSIHPGQPRAEEVVIGTHPFLLEFLVWDHTVTQYHKCLGWGWGGHGSNQIPKAQVPGTPMVWRTSSSGKSSRIQRSLKWHFLYFSQHKCSFHYFTLRIRYFDRKMSEEVEGDPSTYADTPLDLSQTLEIVSLFNTSHL